MTHVVVNLDLVEPMRDEFRQFFASEFPHVTLDLIGHHSELTALRDRADIVITFGRTLGPNADRLLGGAPRLKWVQSLGTGVNNIIDLPSLSPNVVITSMRGIHGVPMSESTIMLMLALSRNLPTMLKNQAGHHWEAPASYLLQGTTVGILGVGAISSVLAPLCKAFGMTVVGVSTSPRDVPGFDRMVTRDRLKEVVPQFDYLVLLTPATAETHHIINADILAAMKPSSYLINVGRGELVDEQALRHALEQGHIAGAGLDALPEEPLPAGHPMWSAKNTIITPHVAAHSEATARSWFRIIGTNLRAFLANDISAMVNVIRSPQ